MKTRIKKCCDRIKFRKRNYQDTKRGVKKVLELRLRIG
jgi:hypothetical protein